VNAASDRHPNREPTRQKKRTRAFMGVHDTLGNRVPQTNEFSFSTAQRPRRSRSTSPHNPLMTPSLRSPPHPLPARISP
jgi:hypothetical protein